MRRFILLIQIIGASFSTSNAQLADSLLVYKQILLKPNHSHDYSVKADVYNFSEKVEKCYYVPGEEILAVVFNKDGHYGKASQYMEVISVYDLKTRQIKWTKTYDLRQHAFTVFDTLVFKTTPRTTSLHRLSDGERVYTAISQTYAIDEDEQVVYSYSVTKGHKEATLIAIDAVTGAELWSSKVLAHGEWTHIESINDTTFLAVSDGIISFDPRKGVLWAIPAKTTTSYKQPGLAVPLFIGFGLVGVVVYYSLDGHSGGKFHLASYPHNEYRAGDKILLNRQHSNLLHHEGYTYFSDINTIIKFDPKGHVVWKRIYMKAGPSMLAIIDNKLLCISKGYFDLGYQRMTLGRGEVMFFDLETGKREYSFATLSKEHNVDFVEVGNKLVIIGSSSLCVFDKSTRKHKYIPYPQGYGEGIFATEIYRGWAEVSGRGVEYLNFSEIDDLIAIRFSNSKKLLVLNADFEPVSTESTFFALDYQEVDGLRFLSDGGYNNWLLGEDGTKKMNLNMGCPPVVIEHYLITCDGARVLFIHLDDLKKLAGS